MVRIHFYYKKMNLGIFLTIFVSFSCTMLTYTKVLDWNETRRGLIQLSCPMSGRWTPIQFNWEMAGLLYGCMILSLVKSPWENIGKTLLTLMLSYWVRAFFLYLVPIKPYPGMPLFEDPFIQLLFSRQQTFQNDIFTSGHTLTHVAIALCAPSFLKIPTILSAILSSTFMIWSKTHYPVCVFIAPFITYCCWVFMQFLLTEYIMIYSACFIMCIPFILDQLNAKVYRDLKVWLCNIPFCHEYVIVVPI
jgi:hypothetical protein